MAVTCRVDGHVLRAAVHAQHLTDLVLEDLVAVQQWADRKKAFVLRKV